MPTGIHWLFLHKTVKLRKFLKISLRVLLGLFVLILLLYGFLQTDTGQNWLARVVTKRLSRDLQTHISIKHVDIGLFTFNKMTLEGVLVEDQKKDTLLYAGKFQVRITDWFFFRDKADLKYVGLEDATINLNRKDSIWNYHFLESYFSSSPDTSAKKSAGIHFNLKKVEMKNVRFISSDAWLGTDMTVSVGSMDLDAREISASNRTIDVNSLVLNDPYFSLFSYKGNYVASADPVVIKKAEAQKQQEEWKVLFSRISINNGRFRDDKGSMQSSVSYFDGQHIDFSKINGTIHDIGWTHDTVTGNIDLTAYERSGLVVKKLKAKTTISPKAMIFDDLDLKINRSSISNYFAMRFDKISSMNNFIHAVTMEANFDRSTISSDDIALFAPTLKNWKKNIRIDGRVQGTVDALSSRDLEVWAGNNTYVRGAVSLIGLPKIKETLINIEAQDLKTTYADMVNFIPSVRYIQIPNLKSLGYLRFKGTYTGFINDFVTYGTLQTNLGTLTTDLNMKFPDKGIPVYSGTLTTPGFNLGTFINSPYLGVVDFHGSVKGKGFKWQTVDMKIDGLIHRIEYGNYTYRNIKANGRLANRLFKGEFEINDPNADLKLNGLVDLKSKIPVFDVKADITHADLKALQLTKQDLQLSGLFDLHLQASSLSDMLGTARIYNASLVNKGKRLSFDSLVVSSSYVDGLKRLNLVSNEFDATVMGDFDLRGLPDAFTLLLSRYYPSYIKAPRSVKPQVFTFEITTGNVEDYIKLLDTHLSGFNNSHIKGSLNTTANTMTVDADVPGFGYAQYQFSDVKVKGSGDFEKLRLTGQVMNARIGDSLFFPQTNFSLDASNDVSDVTVTTTSNQAINQANLSAQIKTFSDGATVLFRPSSFVLNSKTWTLENGGELNFRKNTIVQGGVTFRESNQEIRLWTQPDPEGSWNNLHVAFQNVNIGDFSAFISRKERIEGLLNGEAVVIDPQNKLNVTTDLHFSELRWNNDSLGKLDARLDYNNKTGMLTGRAFNLDTAHHIDVDVAMNFKDTANIFQDRINMHLNNFQLSYLNRFLGTVFSDITGYATGNFDIIGEGDDRAYLAKARLHNAGFKVNFTQVAYTIDDADFEMKKNLINLNNLRIRDQFGNSAMVKGFIRHNAFSNMYYDIKVETESRQMELLNTTFNDNQTFFGKAMGSGTFVLVGYQSDMLMNIDAKASETDSSFITLPPSNTRESGQADFMVERKYGREMVPSTSGLATNLTYNINLTANPHVNVSVILDELTQDVIRGKGSGNLQINSGTSAPLTLQGKYNIEEGEYVFTFQSFLGKTFVLKKGGNNYIEWNGDPYDANIHLDAIYTAKQVSFAPLAGTLFTGANSLATNRDDVDVLATLTGNLFHPNFSFKLDFPTDKPVYNTPDFQFALQQMERNQNELNKQVTYLIVFNSFAPFESNMNYNPFGEFTYNTISGLLFGKVNEQLNKILSKILQNNNATLNFTGSLYNRNLVDPTSKNVFRLPNQSNVNLSLGVPLFNGRAHFTIGASVDVPLGNDFQQTIRLFPDVTLELLVNKSGSVRATFFYRQNVDFLAGNTPGGVIPRRYGASIGYGKEYDNLSDLFGGKKKKARNVVPPVKPVVDSSSTH